LQLVWLGVSSAHRQALSVKSFCRTVLEHFSEVSRDAVAPGSENVVELRLERAERTVEVEELERARLNSIRYCVHFATEISHCCDILFITVGELFVENDVRLKLNRNPNLRRIGAFPSKNS